MEVARFGIDTWMTVTAIAEGFRVAQSRQYLTANFSKHAPSNFR
jgi:hypothetical protein